MKQTFSGHLLEWYDRERRHLPWRSAPGEHAEPYHVWLSEVMLQQTTVATVKAYFKKFLGLWPTVEALAAAPQEQILKEWAGLGYYARARNLHACAQKITQNYGGRFPASESELLTLPGIGDYTAAAIAAIAFDIPATVVDGNIERVISRINRISTPLPEAKKPIKQATEAVTPKKRAGDFAQAMMDLGASLCTPKSPKCLLCPVQTFCGAARAGDMTTYPVKKPKRPKPTRRAVSFWIRHEGHILLERRANKGLLGGMPGLFSTTWAERGDFPTTEEWMISAPFKADWTQLDGQATHTFTHFHLETILVSATAPTRLNMENGFWHPEAEINHVGLPTVFAKMAKLANNQR